MNRTCCSTEVGRPHTEDCVFNPETSPPIDYNGPCVVLPDPPIVDIALDRAMRRGVAQQLRALANVLDPPS